MNTTYKQLAIGGVATTALTTIYNAKGGLTDAQFPILSTIVQNCLFYNNSAQPATITFFFTPANASDDLAGRRALAQSVTIPSATLLLFDDELTLSRQNLGGAAGHRGDLLSLELTGTSLDIQYVLHGLEVSN